MPEFILDRREMDFVLYEQFDLAGLSSLDAYKEMSRDDFDAVVDTIHKFATEVIAPGTHAADQVGCKLENGAVKAPEAFRHVYRKYAEDGWVALSRPAKFGGMGLPLPLTVAVTEIAVGAGPSFAFFPGLAVAAGHVLENFGSPELRDLIVPKYYSGEWAGTMCLTEAQAGTAVGEVTTAATPIEGTDQYAIKGNKQFITAGDHDLAENIVHLVLARVPGDPLGTKGISLFAVPKIRFGKGGNLEGANDVVVTALEHKMGIHASPTCSLSFGDNDDCRGALIGERCKGIVYMFQMMNEARIVCGSQGAAAANGAYQLALAYARERVQGAKVTDRSEAPKPVAIIEHPDVRRNLMLCKAHSESIRAMLVQTAFYAEQAENHPDEAEKAKSRDLLDLMTPVCKAYATDIGFRVTEIAIQIHGGYGYISEYGVEQMMRDVKIGSLYEGTNGVQALDLLGRKMRQRDGALFMTWLQEVNTFVTTHGDHPRLKDVVASLAKAKDQLGQTAMSFMTQGKEDPELPLLGATPFLEMFGHVESARLLIHQAVVADDKLQALLAEHGTDDTAKLAQEDAEARFYDGKVKSARFFVNTVLPHATALGKSIQAGDRSALDIVF